MQTTQNQIAGKPADSTGRARRRAIRALAERAGIAYSEARRQLDRGLSPDEMLAASGRTIYPPTRDTHRLALVAARERRPFDLRVADTRRAADVPQGRAEHLTDRFPPDGAGLLYHGEHRREILTLAYATVAQDAPELVPPDLPWTAELGEETAVDLACAGLDRVVRRLLDAERVRLSAAFAFADDLSYDGARQILDGVLIVGDDGHAPGTRVRMLTAGSHLATIVLAVWGPSGPPVGYVVQPDGSGPREDVAPDDLAVSFAADQGYPWNLGPRFDAYP